MENPPETAQRLFVKADEIDSGTSILSPGQKLPLSALAPPDAAAPAGNRPKAPPRPLLRRDASAPPPPPSQPPPAPPAQVLPEGHTDSLSLPQLKQLVRQFPKMEARAYDFHYSDSQDFATEIEQWFRYTEQDQALVLCSRDTFEQLWKTWYRRRSNDLGAKDPSEWLSVEQSTRQHFLRHCIVTELSSDVGQRVETLECLTFLLLGVWSFTSGLPKAEGGDSLEAVTKGDEHQWNLAQVDWMHKGADLLATTDNGTAIKWLIENFKRLASQHAGENPSPPNGRQTPNEDVDMFFHETKLTLTCLYILIESARFRKDTNSGKLIARRFLELPSSILVSLVELISRLRWEEEWSMPLPYIIQLFWKAELLLLGDITNDYENAKNFLQPGPDQTSPEASYPVLTASPLDYHLFRQEITSKYPAYNPPPPLIPLEVESRSMLPPLPHSGKQEQYPGGTSGVSVPPSGSILHQPVHIATPAPSPPPTPIGPGGKAGKKQNYQTNQNFPFLYPPLDDSSNMMGGRGSTELQDLMVGRKWEGSDIPTSILEAGELFASRIRMTRAVRQLWEERDLFMKYDRGWRRPTSGNEGKEQETDNGRSHTGFSKPRLSNDRNTTPEGTEALSVRLQQVEELFHRSLPNLQSFVIVLMKVMLKNVQEIAMQGGGFQDANQPGGLNRTKSAANMTQNQTMSGTSSLPQPQDMSIDDLEVVRSREISMSAISGSIFVMLKWFKISHILKFEYLTQLLLDSNYLQLTLKYFAHQNLEDLVAIKYDRQDSGFFHFCHLNSDHPPLSPASAADEIKSDTSSIDDAIPPPIPRHSRSQTSTSDKETDKAKSGVLDAPTIASPPRATTSPLPMTSHLDSDQTSNQRFDQSNFRPTVDELGNPTSPLPASPITTYSYRIFQTSIHLLRVLQKLTRGKSHRVLLLVQFKSSQILRRLLRIPDPTLRLYVLKLFKSQVPYCGRKWRQSNMRVITAVYLHVRPELRDEWLVGLHDASAAAAAGASVAGGSGAGPGVGGTGAGAGGDAEIDEAVPMEWALRGLTFWWMKRCYPDVMKLKAAQEAGRAGHGVKLENMEGSEDGEKEWEGGQEIEEEERDFFQREIDAMGWGVAALGLGGGEDVEFGEEAPGIVGANGVVQLGEGVEATEYHDQRGD